MKRSSDPSPDDHSATAASENISIEEPEDEEEPDENEDFDELVSSPSSKRKVKKERTNKKGLPRTTLRLILFNILRFDGLDKFRSFCNENKELIGAHRSKVRKQVQNKRYHYLALRRNDPEEFFRICSTFELDLPSESTRASKKHRSALPSEEVTTSVPTYSVLVSAEKKTPTPEIPKKGEMSYIGKFVLFFILFRFGEWSHLPFNRLIARCHR